MIKSVKNSQILLKNYSKSSITANFDYLTLKPSILVKELKISSKNSSNLSQQAKNRSKKEKTRHCYVPRDIQWSIFSSKSSVCQFLALFFARA